MSTIAQILDGMADSIRSVVDDVTDVDTQVEPRMVLNPTPPTIDMWPGDPSTDQQIEAFGENIGAEIVNVRVRVSTADEVAGQDLLLALMDDEDPLSVVAAINDDPTLGGMITSLDILSRSGYTLFPVLDGEALLGCLFTVEVVKARS